MMMTTYIGPTLDAEIAYRQARIAHDHAAAAEWSHRVRRMGSGVRRLLGGSTEGTTAEMTEQRDRTVTPRASRAAAR